MNEIIAMNPKPTIIFWGTPDFAVPALQALIAHGWPLKAVISTPDAPIGRKRVLTPSPVKTSALAHQVPVLTPERLKDDLFFEQFQQLAPDLCIIVAYGKIIPARYLAVPRFGFVNIHPSLLPRYRGPSPIQAALLNGDVQTGVTLMQIDTQMDHGPIIAQVTCPIAPDEMYSSLASRLAVVGAELLIQSLLGYVDGTLIPQSQDDIQATTCHMITREDGRINWNQTARQIHNQIRALNPDPGTWTTWQNQEIKIKRASIVPGSADPGTFTISPDKAITVGTSQDLLLIEELQLTGGKPLTARQFLAGHRDFEGTLV